MSTWKRRLEPLARPFFFFWSRLTRGKTLGVRALVTDEQGRVLLIEHTYVLGWWLPGGGVDRGETAHQAVARELRE
jgi:8-oxo-dGTP pyrophosphatase MutT (NUDIX family)